MTCGDAEAGAQILEDAVAEEEMAREGVVVDEVVQRCLAITRHHFRAPSSSRNSG